MFPEQIGQLLMILVFIKSLKLAIKNNFLLKKISSTNNLDNLRITKPLSNERTYREKKSVLRRMPGKNNY
jgi:hypothetical protein